MTAYTVTLGIPPPMLSPNARPKHWAVKSQAKKKYRSQAAACTLEAIGTARPMLTAARSQVTWYTKTKRRPDADNALASLKSGFDGMTDAGLLADDRDLSHDAIRFEVDKANPRVVVTIVPLI